MLEVRDRDAEDASGLGGRVVGVTVNRLIRECLDCRALIEALCSHLGVLDDLIASPYRAASERLNGLREVLAQPALADALSGELEQLRHFMTLEQSSHSANNLAHA